MATNIDLLSLDLYNDDAPLPLRGSRQPRRQMRNARPHDDSVQVRNAAKATRKALSRWFDRAFDAQSGRWLAWQAEQQDMDDSDWLAEWRDYANMGGALIDDYRGWGPHGNDAA